MNDFFIDEKFLVEIKLIIEKICPGAVVWAYGSRVRGDAHEGSDLDLVVRTFGPENKENTCAYDLKEAFENSNIPFLIDVLYWDFLPKSFQTEIEKKYIVIYG